LDVIGVGTWDGLWVQAHSRYVNKVFFEMVLNSPNNVFAIGALGFFCFGDCNASSA